MGTPRRALPPKDCIICGQQWTPRSGKQAREKTTCSTACAGRAGGLHRTGLKRAQKSDPAGRTCTRCGHWKGWGQFAWTVRGERRAAWCRGCVRAYNAAYRQRYRSSINAGKRQQYAAGTGRWRGRQITQRWRKTFLAHDRKVERTRLCAQLVGAYFRDYATFCAHAERPTLYLHARMALAWLLRSHAWMSEEQIAAALRTSTATVRWYVASVRRVIRDQAPHGGQCGRPWGREETERLKAHAQELLRRAEGHAPGSLEPSRQPHDDELHSAPSAMDTYWRKRAAQRERDQHYG